MSKNRFRVCKSCGRRIMEAENGVTLEQRVALRLRMELYSFDGEKARRVGSLYQQHQCEDSNDDSVEMPRATREDQGNVPRRRGARRQVQIPGDTNNRRKEEQIQFEIGQPYGVKEKAEVRWSKESDPENWEAKVGEVVHFEETRDLTK